MLAGLVAVAAWAEPQLEHLGTFVWERPESYFGGWSGIDVTDDGLTFFAVADDAQTYEGVFERTEGRITGISRRPIGALVAADGLQIFRKDDATLSDSEGLTQFDDGYAVSFERQHRILVYGLSELPTVIDLPRELFSGRENGGVEALATDTAGRLVAIPETPPAGEAGSPIWRQTEDGWEIVLVLERTQGFAPVGADFAGDGRLFVLERAFRGIGFQSRIRIVDFETGLNDVIWTSRLRAFDNLEGIAVWQGDDDALRITMISDDNYSWLQRTEIVEFRLTE